jgi:CRISPR-associated protein Cas2
MLVLIAYDIANDKRLRRVAQLMESYGARVQRSVFECRITQNQLDELIEKVKAMIKRREDRVHIYRLCETCQERFADYGCGHLSQDARTWVF